MEDAIGQGSHVTRSQKVLRRKLVPHVGRQPAEEQNYEESIMGLDIMRKQTRNLLHEYKDSFCHGLSWQWEVSLASYCSYGLSTTPHQS
jgi:hypothetical protein